MEEELSSCQHHREHCREQHREERGHGWPAGPDDEEADRNKRQQFSEGNQPVLRASWREGFDVVRGVQVALWDRQFAGTDVIHDIARCAHIGLADLPLPWAASMDLAADGDLTFPPDSWGIRREARG